MGGRSAQLMHDELGAFVVRPYVLDPRPWPAELEQELVRIDSDVAPAWYRAEYDAGRLELLAITRPGSSRALCYLLTRRELDPPDFVIVAAVSLDAHYRLTAAVLPELEARARQLGCTAVRFHTRRWGLAAIAGDLGYPVSEIVLRKVL